MSDDLLRGGMVGAGVWSENQLDAWQKVSGAKISALCDRIPDRLEQVANRFEIHQRYTDPGEMIARENLDFLDICVRPASHAQLIRLAVLHRLPVICQKPFCTSLTEAVAVVQTCNRADARLMINENFRWQPWYRKVREILDSGIIGEPFFVKIEERARTTLPHFDHPQAYLAEMPNLILYEMGVHYLDTLRFLFGMPAAITARLHHISPLMQGEDVQVILLDYPHLTAVIESSWVSVPIPGIDAPADGSPALISRLEVDGSQGTLSLAVDGTLSLYTDRGDKTWHFSPDTEADGRRATLQHFIDCLHDGCPFETGGSDNLETMALVWAGYRSAEALTTLSPAELLRDAREQTINLKQAP